MFESVNKSLEWFFTIYQYVLLRLLVRWSWLTVNPCRSFRNGFVSQGSKNFGKIILGGKCPFVRTKKLSGQFLLSVLSMPFFCLYHFLSIRPLICCLSNLCPYLCQIVQKGNGNFFRNIFQLLINIMGLNNHNLYHKTLKQVTTHSTQNFIF